MAKIGSLSPTSNVDPDGNEVPSSGGSSGKSSGVASTKAPTPIRDAPKATISEERAYNKKKTGEAIRTARVASGSKRVDNKSFEKQFNSYGNSIVNKLRGGGK